jgi:hypothetical protein
MLTGPATSEKRRHGKWGFCPGYLLTVALVQMIAAQAEFLCTVALPSWRHR